jgi:hypothetical protein
MPASRNDFDPLAAVIDWLDACRAGEMDALLGLYAERATIECACEQISITGRAALREYWRDKIAASIFPAFRLEDMTLSSEGVQVDYQNFEGRPVRIRFKFDAVGKIVYTACEPIARCGPNA